MEKLNKPENKILIMLLPFSISLGLWNNFRQLWMQDNSLNITEISQILSLGSLTCIIAIMIFSKYVKIEKIKKFITISLLLKIINLTLLFLINNTNSNNLINTLIITDIILEKLLIISIYPLIITIKKSNTLYSKRKLIEYTGRDLGILIGGFFIGKTILGIMFNYNICLLISIIFTIISFIIMTTIKLKPKPIKQTKEKIIKYILKDKIKTIYLIYYLIGQIALSTGLGLKILVLTDALNFTPQGATNYLLIIGILADIIGIIALKYLNPKNEYISITIKFTIRFIGYTLAFLTNNIIVIMCALTWSLLISTAYENVTDAPYLNNIDLDKQLPFTNVRNIVGVLGEAIGTFLCGVTYVIGINYMFGLSALFMIGQITLSYILIHLRKQKG